MNYEKIYQKFASTEAQGSGSVELSSYAKEKREESRARANEIAILINDQSPEMDEEVVCTLPAQEHIDYLFVSSIITTRKVAELLKQLNLEHLEYFPVDFLEPQDIRGIHTEIMHESQMERPANRLDVPEIFRVAIRPIEETDRATHTEAAKVVDHIDWRYVISEASVDAVALKLDEIDTEIGFPGDKSYVIKDIDALKTQRESFEVGLEVHDGPPALTLADLKNAIDAQKARENRDN